MRKNSYTKYERIVMEVWGDRLPEDELARILNCSAQRIRRMAIKMRIEKEELKQFLAELS